jgi:hypothetical protein
MLTVVALLKKHVGCVALFGINTIVIVHYQSSGPSSFFTFTIIAGIDH